eukprot:m.43006 g.43006  ORF g.43006 m.43006 type:complete len:466 (-) comp10754_c0_seq2:1326-2723(-)
MNVSGKRVIVLVGGSNGTHVLAADLGRREDYEVRLLTRRPSQWSQTVTCAEQKFLTDAFPMRPCPTWWETYKGTIDAVYDYSECDKALEGAHMALMVCPVSAHEDLLKHMFANLPSHPLIIGTTYGQGGFDWLCRKLLHGIERAHLVTLFAFKHYPFLCKAKKYGHQVNLFGRFPDLRAAVSPNLDVNRKAVAFFCEEIFGKKLQLLDDFMACTVGASNQVLHPSICTSLFFDYVPGETVYDRHKGFYVEVDTKSSEYMFDLFVREIPLLSQTIDRQFAKGGAFKRQVSYEMISELAGRLPAFAQPKSLFSAAIGWAFRSNQRLTQVKAPMLPVTTTGGKQGFVPAVNSRFFQDDIAHGLCVLLGIAEILEIDLPRVRYLIRTCQFMMSKDFVSDLPDAQGHFLCGTDICETSAPQAYGITTKEQLVEFCKWEREPVVPVCPDKLPPAKQVPGPSASTLTVVAKL